MLTSSVDWRLGRETDARKGKLEGEQAQRVFPPEMLKLRTVSLRSRLGMRTVRETGRQGGDIGIGYDHKGRGVEAEVRRWKL
jgi:hypothetical protein